ncbi:M23 family metallopeptidase [Mucilaginibacter sp. UR6-11]|uniref:M23 family metallopeptidase n=1 Tax=Mucilaginibacter sp. UR6-11 TaxID=1435644 RepID=UPI001E51B002|nr:M23 family metallopeptidase [Mucilaginibacter sp. UR6-11]MCC8423920.1 M23 family metallopeptidase [Mucilaginibacter sp. UR6-11]
MKKIFFIVLLFIDYQFAPAQNTIQSQEYPQGFFRYPLDLPPSTAGGFGEIRPNHFHAGLDFRTNQQSGYPVHAAADGYVSRIRVQFGGGGNIVYINHPNGFTTVYMHNQKFSPQIARVLHDYQYEHQLYEVDFNLQPGQLQVCKDDVIAISGQSGAVAGPHLHFEIRDTKTEHTINPQLFGITIPDRIPPAISAIGIYQMDGPFSENTPRQFLAVGGAPGNYHLVNPKVIELSGNIGFGITTIDKNSASVNPNGVYSIQLNLDGKTVYTFSMEHFAFDQTHAINGYIDYPTFLTQHRFIQKCFVPPGSHISLYPQAVNRGIINFDDDNLHDVQYVVKDVAGNTSTLNIKVKSTHLLRPTAIAQPSATMFHYDRVNQFTGPGVKIEIDPGNLYDDIDFKYEALPAKPGAYSITHRIHNKFTPIHDHYDIWIKPDVDLGNQAGKAVITGTTGVCDSCIYENGFVKGRARGFGDFYITLDTTAPYITPLNIHNGVNLSKAKAIYLRIGDNLSGVKTYNGKIDGKWVLMAWDFKTKVLSYTFDESIAHGRHTFELNVGDAKNNVSQFTAEFSR